MYLTQTSRASRPTFTGSSPMSPCLAPHNPSKSLRDTPHTSHPILNVGHPTIDTFCYFSPNRLQQCLSMSQHRAIAFISMFANSWLNMVWREVPAGVLTCGVKSGTKVSLRSTGPFLDEKNPNSQSHPGRTAMQISVGPGDTSSRLPELQIYLWMHNTLLIDAPS